MMSLKQNSHLSKCIDQNEQNLFPKNEVYRRVIDICKQLEKRGAHSSIVMSTAGLTYTGTDDIARCATCELQVSGLTENMDPFAIHAERSPSCAFVQSMQSKKLISSSFYRALTIDDQENPSKRQKMNLSTKNSLVEVQKLKEVRCRTFSNWPHRQTPSSTQMISAGFFYSNVGDRVICLYCNLICQQWIPGIDDPCEVHQTLSPQCLYVRCILKSDRTSSISILNESSADNTNTRSFRSGSIRLNEVVQASACHITYAEIPKRHASFASWSQEALPSVDDLVRAGFFYTGVKTVVTCFYCNGSLQNWGPKDNPTVEHVRWFPLCAYAKQLCGDELYRKIQKTKLISQGRIRTNQSKKKGDHSSDSSELQKLNENTLSRLIAARLDLPISHNLLNQNFKLSVIKRCWEDQLRLKEDDFVTDCDLLIACIILQKQIDHINGNKENIIIPSIKMNMIREKEQNALTHKQSTPSSSTSTIQPSLLLNPSNGIDIKSSIKSTTVPITSQQKAEEKTSSTSNSSSSNVCVLCLTEEKHLACMPCGHLATCVPCGHSLKTCPMCRREIEAFIRIYI